ncbi:C-C motif chemokine 4-like [Clarias gariepinus]|uniref:C-C motif chemokine 4-like n=1 Tax=Clarias gariepinus TaxID=13013 RepID=UPI00234CFF34|nr:C-C motif chemokine 4-like [Clarias gariepinus]
MRNLTALLLLLSLSSLYLVSSAPPGTDVMKTCCSNPTKARIPLKNIVTYWRTSSSCHLQAIVFQMLNKNTTRTVCVDPTAVWVDSHMRKVDLKNKVGVTAKL